MDFPITSNVLPNPDECWLWPLHTDLNGYGVLKVSGANQRVPRLVFRLFCGQLTQDDLVLHSCDNPRCYNPLHLSKGDNIENHRQRGERMRTSHGEKHGNSILTDDIVRAIIADRKHGMTQVALAAKYETARSNIAAIVKGKSWKHISVPLLTSAVQEEDK